MIYFCCVYQKNIKCCVLVLVYVYVYVRRRELVQTCVLWCAYMSIMII